MMNKNMTLISSIPQLINALNQFKKNEYQEILRQVKLEGKDVKKYCTWEQENYTRNLINYNECYHLLILCWQKGQYSSIHDHGERDCFIYVIEGEIQENIYQLGQENDLINCKENIYKKGQNSYIIDEMGMHEIQCLSEQSITLHLYAKPIKHYHIFDLKTRKLVQKEYTLCPSN